MGSGFANSRSGRFGASFVSRNLSHRIAGLRILRRDGRTCGFGNVRVLGPESQHALSAKPRGQAVDQERDLLLFVRVGQRRRLGLATLRARRFEPDEVEPETGIERIGERIQPLAEQLFDHHRIAQRLSGLDGDAANLRRRRGRTMRPACARAFAAALQHVRERAGQAPRSTRGSPPRSSPDRRSDAPRWCRAARGAARSASPHGPMRNRASVTISPPKRLASSPRCRLATSPMVFKPGAFQRMLDRAIEAERRDGKRSDRLRFLSRRCDRTVGVARERACGAPRFPRAPPDRKTLPL